MTYTTVTKEHVYKKAGGGTTTLYEVIVYRDGKWAYAVTQTTHAAALALAQAWIRAHPEPSPTPTPTPVIIPPDPLPPAPGPDPWDGGEDSGWDTGGKLEPKDWAFNTSWNVSDAPSDFWALGNAWESATAGWGVGREDTWSADDTTWGAIMEMFGFGGESSGVLGW